MIDLPKKLRITAGVINMGGRIAWGSDTALMEEAAERIKQQAVTIEQLMHQRDSYRHEANALNIDNEQQAKTIDNLQLHNRGLYAELNSVNEYKDKLTTAVLVLVDQCKSGEVSLGAIYDVDVLLGE